MDKKGAEVKHRQHRAAERKVRESTSVKTSCLSDDKQMCGCSGECDWCEVSRSGVELDVASYKRIL